MISARIVPYTFKFSVSGQTSRGVLSEKTSWHIFLHDSETNYTAIGECAYIPKLSIDDTDDYIPMLHKVAAFFNKGLDINTLNLSAFPSIAFGLEMALIELANQTQQGHVLFPSAFTRGEIGIDINGLIWMGSREYLEQQIEEKLEKGFTTLKLKVGSLSIETELEILHNIRKRFSPNVLTIRLDANGAFAANQALAALRRYSTYVIHSIEQPIKQGQYEQMAELCTQSPIAIALDEDLIGIQSTTEKEKLITTINPSYIILKPSLLGGFNASEEWIELANKHKIAWWVTSALEGNIGLNAIAQWTYTLNNNMPQGLGTGMIYSNNFASPLTIETGKLFYNPNKTWQINMHNF